MSLIKPSNHSGRQYSMTTYLGTKSCGHPNALYLDVPYILYPVEFRQTHVVRDPSGQHGDLSP